MKIKYYLIGIGGISMSAIALYLSKRGFEVTGSDLIDSPQTRVLKKQGLEIDIRQTGKNITEDISLVIYSSAITHGSKGYLEIDKARKLGIRTVKRSDFLGELFNDKTLITVSGTHGKSTISAMAAKILIDSGYNPTVFLGANFSGFSGKNFFLGKDKIVVIEACEYDSSFLSFEPQIAVISNIEAEHLDYFKGGIKEIIETFARYIQKIKRNGFLIYWDKDKQIKKAIKLAKRKDITYIKYAQDINCDIVSKIELKIPGTFNIDNALAAYSLTLALKVPLQKIVSSLNNFSGLEHRLELKYRDKKVLVFDDYAHHPTEIKFTLKAIRERYPKRRVVVVFQPHQYSRTKLLFNSFTKAFKDSDLLIVAKVFEVSGRDEKKEVGSAELVKGVKRPKAIHIPTFSGIVDYLCKDCKNNDIVITMGAGRVYEVADEFIKKIKNQKLKL